MASTGQPARSSRWRDLRAGLLLWTLVLTVWLSFRALDLNHPYLHRYVAFDRGFDVLATLMRCALVAALSAFAFAAGERVAVSCGVTCRPSLRLALGILALNIGLLPLFFLGWLNPPVLLAVLLLLALLLGRELSSLLVLRGRRFGRMGPLLLVITPLPFYLIDAVMPVGLTESLGDVADAYLRLPMYFAAQGGAAFNVDYASTMTNFENWEVLGASLTVLSNPETIKLLGGALFWLLACIVYDLALDLCRTRWAVLAPVLFLTSPALIDSEWFSLLHPRLYYIFLAAVALNFTNKAVTHRSVRWLCLGIVAMGCMAGATLGGGISLAILGTLLLPQARWFLKSPAPVLAAAAVGGLLAIVFPLWNLSHTGSPAPTNLALSGMLGLDVPPEVYNRYLLERVNLQFVATDGCSGTDVLLFPLRFVFEHYGSATLFVVAALFAAWRATNVRYVLLFAMIHVVVYLALFPSSVHGGSWARFQWVALPALAALAARGAEFLVADLPRIWPPAYRAASRRAVGALCVLAAVLALLTNWYALGLPAWLTLRQRNVPYLTGQTDLATYIGRRHARQAAFLNAMFDEDDHILHLFRDLGIYVEPRLHQASETGFASIIYRCRDPGTIVHTLLARGIRRLTVDTGYYGEIAGNPCEATVQDIATPLFEPSFFVRHFIPVETGLDDFFLFRISERALDGERLAVNRRTIAASGLLDLFHAALAMHGATADGLRGNPYSIRKLMTAHGVVTNEMPLDAGSTNVPKSGAGS